MQQYKFNIQFHYIRGEKMVNNDSIVDQRKNLLISSVTLMRWKNFLIPLEESIEP